MNLRGFDPGQPPVPPEDALRSLLRGLGADPRSLPSLPSLPSEPGDLARLFRSRCAGRKLLILLDNAASAEQVRPLLAGEPRRLVVVTSSPFPATTPPRSGPRFPCPTGLSTRTRRGFSGCCRCIRVKESAKAGPRRSAGAGGPRPAAARPPGERAPAGIRRAGPSPLPRPDPVARRRTERFHRLRDERAAARKQVAEWYLHSVDNAGRLLIPARVGPELTVPEGCEPLVPRTHQEALSWFDAEEANLAALIRETVRETAERYREKRESPATMPVTETSPDVPSPTARVQQAGRTPCAGPALSSAEPGPTRPRSVLGS